MGAYTMNPARDPNQISSGECVCAEPESEPESEPECPLSRAVVCLPRKMSTGVTLCKVARGPDEEWPAVHSATHDIDGLQGCKTVGKATCLYQHGRNCLDGYLLGCQAVLA